ncbi:hypothetical protein [Bacillus sp. HMF5848]|nr:hypothetical protein [Bacillus sp. HMF5848]
MNSNHVKVIANKNTAGYKVISVNVSVPTENLYAVVTPVKIKD